MTSTVARKEYDDQPMLPYPDLIRELEHFSNERRTGTALIAMEDNTIARFVYVGGEITYADYRLRKGEEALQLFRGVQNGRVRFSSRVAVSERDPALPGKNDIFWFLGIQNLVAEKPSKPRSDITLSLKQVLKIIEEEIVDCVGPMGSILMQEVTGNERAMSIKMVAQVIEALARQIGDHQRSERFRKKTLSRLNIDS